MTITKMTLTTLPTGLTTTRPMAFTTEEARRFAREQNARERARRQREDEADEARRDELARLHEDAQRYGPARSHGLRAADVYRARAERETLTDEVLGDRPASPPQSLAELARDYYGGGASGPGLIASGARGGRA